MISAERPYLFLEPARWEDYALLDSGNGVKLERLGPYRFIRPEPQALWPQTLPKKDWYADATFVSGAKEDSGTWRLDKRLDGGWPVHYGPLLFTARVTPFRHLGVFPEQASQWDWITEKISQAKRPANVLNLFGYTGIASLAAVSAGASVTHVDASKQAVQWARENQGLSHLEAKPIRWIVDDALKYVQREVRRGVRYDGLIIDPPKFGHGPDGELWKFETSLPELLRQCRLLLSDQPLFTVLTAYAIKTSALSLGYALETMFDGRAGQTEVGELGLHEQSSGRLLPQAIFARWSATGPAAGRRVVE